MLKVKKINNVIVKPPKILTDNSDKRPVRGANLFSDPYSNVFVCARKKSGKSVVIHNILKECVGRDTTVIFFVSTLYKDPVYKNMLTMCEKNNINYIGYTSLKEDGVDHLQDLVDSFKAAAEKKHEEEQKEIQDGGKKKKKQKGLGLFQDDPDDDEKEVKPRKLKYLAPEYIFIFDDLSNETKSKSLVTLLKNNRHWKLRIILSSQYYNDLLPESRKQIDIFIIFKSIIEAKLFEIFKDADLSVTFPEFLDIYKWATKEPYSFLYVDRLNSSFRRNFNMEISINDIV